MSSFNNLPSKSDFGADRTLTRLADVLGCPVDVFSDEAREPLGVRGASELLGLWVEIDDDGDRERLLEFARTLARV